MIGSDGDDRDAEPDTTVDVCVRCGERDPVSGRFGYRCQSCLRELQDETESERGTHDVPVVTRTTRADSDHDGSAGYDDARGRRLRDALDPLSRCRSVTSAGVYGPDDGFHSGSGERVEVVLADGTHGVPVHVAEILSSYGLEITAVTPLTVDPVQLLVVAR